MWSSGPVPPLTPHRVPGTAPTLCTYFSIQTSRKLRGGGVNMPHFADKETEAEQCIKNNTKGPKWSGFC